MAGLHVAPDRGKQSKADKKMKVCLSFLQKGIVFEIRLDDEGMKGDAEKEKEGRGEEGKQEEEKVSDGR